MQEVYLKRVAVNEKQLLRAPPKVEDVSIEVSAPCRIYDEDTGALVAVATQGPPTRSLANKVSKIKFPNPITAGRRLGGYSAGASLTFGFSPKRPIQTNCQTCRSTAIYRDYPVVAAALTQIAQMAWNGMGTENPDRQQHLIDSAKEILPCWKIPGTGFTSGIINKNTPLRYHYDAGNYKDSWSAMLWMCSGVAGGALALPQYNVKIKLQDGAWLYFSGQSVLHGVTPIQMLSKASYRYSIVFYANMEMRNCKSIEEEFKDAKKRRTDSERKAKVDVRPK